MTAGYVPLNGQECIELICQEVRRQLVESGQFGHHVAFPLVTFAVAVKTRCYPPEGQPTDRLVSGALGDVAAEPGAVVPEVEAAEPAPFVRGHVVEAPGRDREGLDNIPASMRTGAGGRVVPREAKPVQVIGRGGAAAPAVRSLGGAREAALADGGLPAGLDIQPDGRNTVRRLPVSGGGMMPGEVMRPAVKPMPPGVVTVTSPNAARREAGLATPAPRVTPMGQIVDSF